MRHFFTRAVQGTSVLWNKIEEMWLWKGQVGWELEHMSLDLTIKESLMILVRAISSSGS